MIWRCRGCCHGATVRSPVARGTSSRASTTTLRFPWDEFTIVTANDVPGANRVTLIVDDQPYLADGRINHPEEPILLLAHHDKHLLEQARQHASRRDRAAPARLHD